MIKKLPRLITSVSELQNWRKATSMQIGFVPTMGALHEGHASLLRQIRSRCEVSVLSIFVNPTQFGPKEDLGKYPRTLENDLTIAAEAGVDVVFAPTPHEMYPSGYSTYVEETAVSQPLCGQFRPGHFRGVTTVVLKLLNLVRPEIALFGIKDAQQFFVLKQMVKDLNLDVQIEAAPTFRENDGLAMSSRNVYLSPEERALAPQIYQTLTRLRDEISTIWRESSILSGNLLCQTLSQAKNSLTEKGFRLQYLDCLELPGFKNMSSVVAQESTRSITIQYKGQSEDQQEGMNRSSSYLIAVAAYLGNTRLIDNIILNPLERQI
jgi:pantoate--beta-alanine ligase